VTTAATYRARQGEKDFQAAVLEAASALNWFCLHFPNAVINPAGWPDLICFRDGKTLLMELKRENGRLGPKQIEMIETLEHCGCVVRVFRPNQWDEIEMTLRGEE
jgi:hypothetical protein